MAEINAPPVAIEAPGGQGQIGTTSGGSGQIGTGNGDQGQIGTGGASGPAGQIGTDGGAGSGQGQLPNPGQGSGAGGQPELPKPEERGRRGPGLLLGVLRSGAEAIFGPSSGSVELREPVDVETNAVPGSTTAPGGALSGDDNTSSIPVGTVSQQTRLGARQRGDTPLSVSAKPSVPTPSIGDSRPQPSAIGADFGTSSRGADSVGEGPRIEPAPARPAVSETPHSSVSGASSRSGSLPSGNPSSVYEPDGIFPPGQAVPIETEGPSYIQGPTLLIRGSSPHEAYQALEKLNEAKGQAQGRLGSSDEGGKAGPLSDTPTMVVPVYVGRGGNTAPAAPGTPQLEAGEVTETDIVPVSSGDSGIPDGGAVEIVFDPRGYDGNIQGPVVPVDASSILGTGHSGSSMPVTSVDDSLSDGDTGADSEE